nr:MAG TPA: hypothetical protein [Caudoviricetes sp.]
MFSNFYDRHISHIFYRMKKCSECFETLLTIALCSR